MKEEYRNKTAPNRCNEPQFRGNVSKSIEELYQNIQNLEASPLTVRNNDGTVVSNNVSTLIANCSKVQEVTGGTVRVTPKVSDIFQAPSGGIAAMTTTTVPSAVCTRCVIEDGVLKTTTETETVYNIGSAVTGDAVLTASVVSGCQWVTKGGCCENTSVTPGGGGDPTPDPEPGGDGGSGACAYFSPGTRALSYDIELHGLMTDEGQYDGNCGPARQCFQGINFGFGPSEEYCVPCSQTDGTVVRVSTQAAFFQDMTTFNLIPEKACQWYATEEINKNWNYSSPLSPGGQGEFVLRSRWNYSLNVERPGGQGTWLTVVLRWLAWLPNEGRSVSWRTPYYIRFATKLSDDDNFVIDAGWNSLRLDYHAGRTPVDGTKSGLPYCGHQVECLPKAHPDIDLGETFVRVSAVT